MLENKAPYPHHTLHLRAQLQRKDFALDVDLRLPARGVTALFGPSGSGKTTCLRIMAGLEPHAQAHVQVGDACWQSGQDAHHFVPPHQRAIGYVFQEAGLFAHLNVRDNLRYGYQRTPAAQRRHAWDQGLTLLGIGHLLQRYPHELSGGERQRVAIARALATSPQVLLMDEPLAALDAARKADILPWLEQLHEQLDIPVLYVTHALEEVIRLADHVVLLDQGRVQAQGDVADMLTRTDLPLAQGEGASTLIEALTCDLSQADEGEDLSGMCVLSFIGGRLLIPQLRQPPLPPRTLVRVRIQARDVSLALDPPQRTSILNVLPATITDLTPDGASQMLIGLNLGPAPTPCRLLSRISRTSTHRLGLTVGMPVYAQIKGVALVR
ncbi:MAG: molybdate transporter, ATP-binding protein [Pseudomonadota bacterium]|jgi:molybdate transport system ATP-binding protein